MMFFKVKSHMTVANPGMQTRSVKWDDTYTLHIDCPPQQAGHIAALSYAAIMAARFKASERFVGHCSMKVSCIPL